jgi:hypothetical protein
VDTMESGIDTSITLARMEIGMDTLVTIDWHGHLVRVYLADMDT